MRKLHKAKTPFRQGHNTFTRAVWRHSIRRNTAIAYCALPGLIKDGNEVLSSGSFVQNGVSREALVLNFLADPNGHAFAGGATGTTVSTQGSVSSYVSGNALGEVIDVVQKGVTNAYGAAATPSNKASISCKLHRLLCVIYFSTNIICARAIAADQKPINDHLTKVTAYEKERMSSSREYYEKKEVIDSIIREHDIDVYESGYPFSYASINYFMCGENKVILESFCENVDKQLGYPICQFHKLTTFAKNQEQHFYFLNLHEARNQYPYSPSSLQCKIYNSEHIVLLNWSSLGSGATCNDKCESSDVFLSNGNYLGNTRKTITFTFSTKNEKLTEDDERKIIYEPLQIIDELHINLMPNGFSRKR